MQKKIGPAWTERGRPASGYVTKRLAEDWLASLLDQARRGTLPGMVRTGATFADAADEWLRYLEHNRRRKPSTLEGGLSEMGSVVVSSVPTVVPSPELCRRICYDGPRLGTARPGFGIQAFAPA